jgi:effector-binding domain-containing protein
MSTSPRTETRTEQSYIAIPVTAPLFEWGKVNALIPEVLSVMDENKVAPDGPLFYRYLVATDPDSLFTVEVGFPTERFVPCVGRARADTIPAGRYATLRHAGHPDRLRDSFAVLQEWIAEQGEEPDTAVVDGQCRWAGRFEFYLTDPKEQPDPYSWEIDLAWKLQDKG